MRWMLRATFLASILAVPALSAAQYDRYGVHHAGQAVAAPACDSQRVACFADSTRTYSDECCARSTQSQWLILASSGDSLEFFSKSPTRSTLLILDLPGKGSLGSWQENVAGATAPFVRFRAPSTAAYMLTVELDLDDYSPPRDSLIGWPYELRVHAPEVAALPDAAPLLRLLGSAKSRVLVTPRGLKGKGSPALTVKIPAGSYRVFSEAADSLEICGVPCKSPHTISLRQKGPIAVRP